MQNNKLLRRAVVRYSVTSSPNAYITMRPLGEGGAAAKAGPGLGKKASMLLPDSRAAGAASKRRRQRCGCDRQGACLPPCCRRWMNPVPGRPVKEEQKKSSCAATAERWINCEEDGINPQRQTDTCSHSTAPAAAAAHGCRCSHDESEPASARAPDGVLCGDGKTPDWPTRGGGHRRRALHEGKCHVQRGEEG